MAAGSVVPFCKFADVVKIVSPMADSLKVVIIDIAAGYLSLLAAFCKIPNLVAVLYSEQLFVFGVNEADARQKSTVLDVVLWHTSREMIF